MTKRDWQYIDDDIQHYQACPMHEDNDQSDYDPDDYICQCSEIDDGLREQAQGI